MAMRLIVFVTFLTCLQVKVVFSQPGSLDQSFIVQSTSFAFVYSSAIQADGKIIIGGDFSTINGFMANNLARLNTDGSLDRTFRTSIGASAAVRAIAIQKDGKVLIGGMFSQYNGLARNFITRLNTDGSLDNTFNIGLGADAPIHAIALDPEGKIYIGGQFYQYNGVNRKHIARLHANGELDESFNPGTGPNGFVDCITVLDNTKVMVGGNFTRFANVAHNLIVRLNPNGTLDQGFLLQASVAFGIDERINKIIPLSDGKMMVSGRFTNNEPFIGVSRSNITRLNPHGTVDQTFNKTTATDFTINDMLVQPDGKYLIVGNFTIVNRIERKFIARLAQDGQFDSTFNPQPGPSSAVSTASMQADGKIIIGGIFARYNNIETAGIARINSSNITSTNEVLNDLTRSSISIFPNPILENLHVESSATIHTITLSDISGKQVLKQAVNKKSIELNLRELTPAIYFIYIETQSGQHVEKIVKR